MSLEKVNGIYQGVTDYLNDIKEGEEIDKKEKAAYFYLKNDGQVITQPMDGNIWIMCNNLPEDVARKLESLVS